MTNNNRPTLYTFRRCPYAMRARMAIDYAGIELNQIEVSFKNKPAEMLTASPKGTVPVLVLPDNTVIDESIDVMYWAIKQNDPDNWLPKNTNDKINEWVNKNDFEFKPLLDRYKYPDRFDSVNAEANVTLALDYLAQLEKQLNQTRYLISDYMTIADNALFPFVRQFRNTDIEKFQSLGLTQLEKWLDGFLHSDRFLRVMKKI